jgi:cell division protein FtsW
MNRRIPFDHWIILSLTVLLGMGLVVVYNASSIDYLGKQLIAAILGIALLCTTMKINYRIFNKSIVVFLLAAFSAALLLLPLLMSDPVNGARRWINIKGFTFQPSELAKIVLIILTAHFLASYHKPGNREKTSKYLVYIYFFFAAALTVLVLLGNDLSTAVLMAMIILIMTFLGGLRLHMILGAGALGSIAIFFLAFSESYRARRITAFLDPSADPLGAGFHPLQSLISFGSGGLSGERFSSGAQNLAFLPEAHTDFIFSAIGHETGLIGCLIVLTFFIIFIFRGLRAGYHSDSVFGSFLGLGLASIIGLQALLNMSVALSLCPTTGLPLPFISYGGSSILMMLFATGILLNISSSPRVIRAVRDNSKKTKDFEVRSNSPDVVIKHTGFKKPVYRQPDLPWEEN